MYRQQNLFAQIGWAPNRSTLCQIVATAASLLKALSAHIIAQLFVADMLGTDDTTVTLLTPREGDGSLTARLWLYRGFDDAPYNAFHFTESRATETGPDTFLRNFGGTIVADSFAGYKHIDKKTERRIVHAACHAHVRRRFFELTVNVEKIGVPRLVTRILSVYQLLYDVEDRARAMSVDERLELRRKESQPLMDRSTTTRRRGICVAWRSAARTGCSSAAATRASARRTF